MWLERAEMPPVTPSGSMSGSVHPQQTQNSGISRPVVCLGTPSSFFPPETSLEIPEAQAQLLVG